MLRSSPFAPGEAADDHPDDGLLGIERIDRLRRRVPVDVDGPGHDRLDHEARSDGHVYTTIRYGRRRMPGYTRISSNDRWDIVNYVRYLTKQRGVN